MQGREKRRAHYRKQQWCVVGCTCLSQCLDLNSGVEFTVWQAHSGGCPSQSPSSWHLWTAPPRLGHQPAFWAIVCVWWPCLQHQHCPEPCWRRGWDGYSQWCRVEAGGSSLSDAWPLAAFRVPYGVLSSLNEQRNSHNKITALAAVISAVLSSFPLPFSPLHQHHLHLGIAPAAHIR